MLYDCLKIFHILSAALLVTGIVVSFSLWITSKDAVLIMQRIQSNTLLVIIPFAILQIATGFTMISLEEYDLSEMWIIGSISAFILMISCWFTFLYFLLSGYKRWLQLTMLCLCSIALLSMIFFMANKS